MWPQAHFRSCSKAALAQPLSDAVPAFSHPTPSFAAEHFLAHGDCLMQAVRAVFNLAIGAEAADIKNTARSALLQMVNTVLKRVGQQILVGAAGRCRRACPAPGRAPSGCRWLRYRGAWVQAPDSVGSARIGIAAAGSAPTMQLM